MKISKKILYIAALVIVAIGGGFAAYSYLGQANASQQPADFAVVKPTDITQTVEAAGLVKPANDISLSFERSGKIAGVAALVGQTVRRGQTLASLDTSDLKIQLDSAQNALDYANLKLNQLKNAADPAASGSTEIQTAITNSQENSANKIKEAYSAADGIMGTSVDQFFNEPKSNNPAFGITVTQENSTYMIDAPIETSFVLNLKRRAVTDSMAKWQNDLGNRNQSNIDSAQNDAETSLGQIQSLLNNLAAVVNSYSAASASDNLVYNSYKTTIQNARAAIDSTLAGLLSAKQAYNSSLANANPDDIKMLQIAYANAQNSLDSIKNQIAKSAIYSPINGIVSKQDAKIGETATPGVPLINVFSNSNLQIDVYLPESDIAKVKTGQTATVTLDAFGPQTFAAHIVSLDPAGTTLGYKTTLQFDRNNAQIKPGMTANASIQTAQKSNVLALPARSIIQKDGQSFVMVKTAGQNSEEHKITTGITSANGCVEVVDGLKAGEMIINY